ncbi:MAG: dTDP-4-dehydrorhamnose reductase, partial [Gammaproteobacteria bacterium]
PNAILNATAYTAVDQAESDRVGAFAVNQQGVHNLADACARLSVRLIHVSTDYVFDGGTGRHVSEDDSTAPLGVYGESKLAGERVLSATPNLEWVVVRTAWLYSNQGRNFLNTMLELMSCRDSLNVVCDQVGSPTSALSLAVVLWRIVLAKALRGVFHWTDAGVASWYDFAIAIQEEALSLGILNSRIPIAPILSDQYPTPARRPACVLLDKTKLVAGLNVQPVHWRKRLQETLIQRAATSINLK